MTSAEFDELKSDIQRLEKLKEKLVRDAEKQCEGVQIAIDVLKNELAQR